MALKDKGSHVAVTGKWNAETTKALLLYWKQLGWNKNGEKKGGRFADHKQIVKS